MKFEITNIDKNEWILLDYFLEAVELGKSTEKELLNNESFLHMLSAVKFDSNNFMKIPDFIRQSKLTEKYCEQVNPDIKNIINRKTLTKVDTYKNYLGL